ncbi:MAG TPA: hypothetical protein VMP11_14340 [Verrucomicrobiae bacterium]|nr:hypothetical protein [Verrucomicrobiae bacterium]
MARFEIACILLAAFAVSCNRGVSRIQILALSQPNPTTYSFPLAVGDFHARAVEAFSTDHQVKDPIFPVPPEATSLRGEMLWSSNFSVELSGAGGVFSSVFTNLDNDNDIYLQNFDMPFTLSPLYRGRNGGLPFVASFYLHLVAASSSTTVVMVTAMDTRVINGEHYGVGPCGPGYGWRYDPVKPTTVEEYTILRYLGDHVGISNMPPVILPRK